MASPVTEFTPWASLAGGLLIGLSAAILIVFTGRIAGISGIAGRLLPPYSVQDHAGPAAFVGGLIASPFLVQAFTGNAIVQSVPSNALLMIGAGLLVGFGATWGNGCTSGHGVCGLARFSPRSMAATGTFMATAVATVFIARHLIGG